MFRGIPKLSWIIVSLTSHKTILNCFIRQSVVAHFICSANSIRYTPCYFEFRTTSSLYTKSAKKSHLLLDRVALIRNKKRNYRNLGIFRKLFVDVFRFVHQTKFISVFFNIQPLTITYRDKFGVIYFLLDGDNLLFYSTLVQPFESRGREYLPRFRKFRLST